MKLCLAGDRGNGLQLLVGGKDRACDKPLQVLAAVNQRLDAAKLFFNGRNSL